MRLKIFYLILKKDLVLFFRSRASFWATTLFVGGYLALLRLGLPPQETPLAVGVSFMVATQLTASVFLLLFGQVWEREWNAIAYILQLRVSPLALYLAKLVAYFMALMVLWLILHLIGFLFFKLTSHNLIVWSFLGTGFFLSMNASAIGALASGISFQTRYRELIMFLIYIPLILPVGIAAATFYRTLALYGKIGREGFFLTSLFFFFFSLGIFFYEHLLRD
ncbi:MAG: heme exporter protein CcmB [Leptospiraceae bacterium]|nr:heme exporter protein CcmB [Leptospiraceae bacterium]MDW8306285.1 heme exporter protein CcmB [Leptospiraceae bacterium]